MPVPHRCLRSTNVLIETLSCESFRVWYLQSTCGAVPSRVSRFVFWVYVVLRPRTWQASRQWWPRRFYERMLSWETSDSQTLKKPPHHHRPSTSPHTTLHHFVLRSHISPFTCEAWSKRIGFWRFPKDRVWVIFFTSLLETRVFCLTMFWTQGSAVHACIHGSLSEHTGHTLKMQYVSTCNNCRWLTRLRSRSLSMSRLICEPLQDPL